jgi:septal ring-binding cell division protein DamX
VKKETTSSVKKETIPMAKNEVKNEVTPVKSTFAQVASKPKEESNTKASSTNQTEKMSKGVSYRVQICATKRPVNSDYFVKNHQFNEKIYLNMHEGWHKFTVGGFEVYEEARNRREEVKQNNKIPGPFVTAYNKAERITVQEALMITKQKWIP